MNLGKKFWLLTVIVILIMTMIGCGILGQTDVNGEKDRQKVVAEINGEKILKGEMIDIYEQEKMDYGITEKDENDPQKKDIILNFKISILEDLIYGRLAIEKAKDADYTITNELLEEAKKDFDNMVLEIAEQLKVQAKQDKIGNVDYIKKAKEYVESQLKAKGRTIDENINIIAEQKMVEKFMESFVKDVHASDEYIEEYYYNQLEMQIHDPAWNTNREVQIYTPPQIRAKHILIALPEAQQSDYFKLLKEKRYEEAESYLNEKLKSIYPKAQEVLGKAMSGENFEKLINDYGEDPGMKDNKDGYIVQQDGQFIPEFEDAAFKLEIGKISGLVSSPYGYHIIKVYERAPEKIYSLEEKKDEIRRVVDRYKKDEKWHSILEGWAKDAVIKKYEDRL